MAPEKLENCEKKKKVQYDTKCEIYSVGALLWEIAELKKPHSDIDRSEILVNIRTRIRNRYRLPFSYEVPMEWIYIVSRAMEYEPEYRISYYYYHGEEIPELQQLSKKEKFKIAASIFEETADKGNPSAQLRYGICLWKGEGVDANSDKALKYLKMAANSGNSAAMFIIGKAYWNGGNGIEQDKNQGAEYLKIAALNNHPSAKDVCYSNNIIF
ncbi:unnamed protein product [Rhizophagus irregularis]|nr:unnamed protein product [Rhizophagus irregularis]